MALFTDNMAVMVRICSTHLYLKYQFNKYIKVCCGHLVTTVSHGCANAMIVLYLDYREKDPHVILVEQQVS